MLFYAQKMPKKDLFAHASQYWPILGRTIRQAKAAAACRGSQGRQAGRTGGDSCQLYNRGNNTPDNPGR
jgi:hypothetical protein